MTSTCFSRGNPGNPGKSGKIRGDPAVVAPGLDAGPLAYSTLVPQPAARVLDRTGAELLTQHVVTLVDVAPDADVAAVAALLNPIAPTITAAKKPVKNQDLWMAMDEACQRHDITWKWVKGHAGDPGNEKADELARRGTEEARGR